MTPIIALEWLGVAFGAVFLIACIVALVKAGMK